MGVHASSITHVVCPAQVLSKKLGRDPNDIVKLDANENLYGPPPEVAKALGSMTFPNIYPDPECRALREKLAQLNGTPAENILVSSQSLANVVSPISQRM